MRRIMREQTERKRARNDAPPPWLGEVRVPPPNPPRNGARHPPSTIEGQQALIIQGDLEKHHTPPAAVLPKGAKIGARFGNQWAALNRDEIEAIAVAIRKLVGSVNTKSCVISFPLLADHNVVPKNNDGTSKVAELPLRVDGGDAWLGLIRRLRRCRGFQRLFAAVAKRRFGLEATFDWLTLAPFEAYKWDFPVCITLMTHAAYDIPMLTLVPCGLEGA